MYQLRMALNILLSYGLSDSFIEDWIMENKDIIRSQNKYVTQKQIDKAVKDFKKQNNKKG